MGAGNPFQSPPNLIPQLSVETHQKGVPGKQGVPFFLATVTGFRDKHWWKVTATAVFFPGVFFLNRISAPMRQLPTQNNNDTPHCVEGQDKKTVRRPHWKFQMRIGGVGTFLREKHVEAQTFFLGAGGKETRVPKRV